MIRILRRSPLGRVAAPSGLRPCFALIASDATSRSAPPTLRPSGYVRFPASIPDPALLEICHIVYTYTGVCIPEREQSYLKSDKTWIKVQFPILSGRHEPHHRWAGAILLIDLINSHVSRRNLLPWKYGEEAAWSHLFYKQDQRRLLMSGFGNDPAWLNVH